jgi:hypothetical protein
MDADMLYFRERSLLLAEKNVKTLGHVLRAIPAAQATSLRDGADGWTPLEIVCHLRDFDLIFYERARQTLEHDQPQFKAYDIHTLATENAYSIQKMESVYGELRESRHRLIAFFKGLTDQEWRRTGIHPSRGELTMMQQLILVGTHDADHLEQITRVAFNQGSM